MKAEPLKRIEEIRERYRLHHVFAGQADNTTMAMKDIIDAYDKTLEENTTLKATIQE